MTAAEAFGVGWAATAALFSVATAVRVRAARRRPPGEGTRLPRWPPVLLLRPVDAPSARELSNLAAPCDYDGGLTHVVVCPYRPALPAQVRWCASDPLSHNRKTGHLLYALAALRPKPSTVVLAVDADVRVDGALVRGLVRPLLEGAALSTAAPRLRRGAGLREAAVEGLLTQTHHSFVALHAMSAGAPAICGKALGLSARAQAVLAQLHGHLGEDLELAKRLHAGGAWIALSDAPAWVPAAGGEPLRAAVDRFTRWMQVLKAHRPALYPTVPLLFCATPLVAAWTLAFGAPALWAALGALLLARTALAFALVDRPALGWLLGEALLVAAFARSLWTRTVTWRGRTFVVARGGRMSPAAPVPGGGWR